MGTIPNLQYSGTTFGADPEFFIREKKTQKVIPADTFLPGKNNKWNTNGGQIFFDGVQAEMNVNYQTCREGFCDSISTLMVAMKHKLDTEHGKDKYELWGGASCKVDKKLILKSDPECRVFGCAPSKNAYNKKGIAPDGMKHMIRYAGGHIHLGTKGLSTKEAAELTKVLDRTVGITATLLDIDPLSIRRRKFYGQAGEFRIQPHGIEYRTLSNFWLRSPQLTSLFLGLSRVAYTIWNCGHADKIIKQISDAKTRTIINNTDTKEARKIWKDIRENIVAVGGPLKSSSDLASFEYLYRIGIHRMFPKDLTVEWIDKYHNGRLSGWNNGMRKRLEGDKRFVKFRTEFMKKEGNKLF